MIEAVLEQDNMHLAWEQVCSKKGSPGLDGVSIERWGRNWEENIERLRQQVITNTYHPGKPKRIKVWKKGGTIRELSLLNISDKVLQRAVLNILENEYEKRFLPCSHGYRTGRSTATAIQQVLNYRDHGLTWVLDADIEACFDNIDQVILMERIKKIVKDWHIRHLMDLWLKVYRKNRNQAVGIPTGAVVSPLWCNIYLHLLDARITCAGEKMIRYADDFLVFAHDETGVERGKQIVIQALDDLHLRLSKQKTTTTCFKYGFRFLGVDFYKDSYSYVWEQKRIRVKGRDLKTLYNHVPSFY